MDTAVDSSANTAGAGLSAPCTSLSAAFSPAADCARGSAGPAVEQDGGVGKREAGGRLWAGVPVELSDCRMAVCKLFDVAGRAKPVLRNGVLCLLRSGGFALRSLQVPNRGENK